MAGRAGRQRRRRGAAWSGRCGGTRRWPSLAPAPEDAPTPRRWGAALWAGGQRGPGRCPFFAVGCTPKTMPKPDLCPWPQVHCLHTPHWPPSPPPRVPPISCSKPSLVLLKPDRPVVPQGLRGRLSPWAVALTHSLPAEWGGLGAQGRGTGEGPRVSGPEGAWGAACLGAHTRPVRIPATSWSRPGLQARAILQGSRPLLPLAGQPPAGLRGGGWGPGLLSGLGEGVLPGCERAQGSGGRRSPGPREMGMSGGWGSLPLLPPGWGSQRAGLAPLFPWADDGPLCPDQLPAQTWHVVCVSQTLCGRPVSVSVSRAMAL